MNRRELDRRRFLKAVGATALTLPFLRGVPSYAGDGGASGGSSGGGAEPVYLVLLFTGCGVVRFKWGAQGPAPTGSTAAVTSPLVFRDTLSAFTQAGPMKVDLTNKVTVLDGLNVKAANGGSHEAGMAALWTGTTIQNNGSAASGPSIDQAIAPLLSSQLGISRPYPTLPLMVQSSADYQTRSVDTRMLYDASGNWVDPYSDPATTLATLFPSAAGGGSKGADKTSFIRQQVAAQVNSELSALQGRLCTQDRQQLQTLQAVWNQAEMQIAAAAGAAASCSSPTLGSAGATPAGSDPFPQNAAAMGSILAMALACDLTRVASLQFSHALSPVTHTWLGASQQQTHHVYSHVGPTSLYSLGADLYAEPSSVTSQYPQQLIDIDAWYAAQVASFAYTLSQLTTASGKSLLDQTVICWGSELDMGAAHNHDDTPFVLVGGAGGRIKTNQLVRFPLNLPGNSPPTGNRFHNDLLTTLAKAMGVSLPGGTFGTAAYNTQPIAEILG